MRGTHITVRKLIVGNPIIQALLHFLNSRRTVDFSVEPNRRNCARFVKNLVTLSNAMDHVVALFIWNIYPNLWQVRRT